MIMKPYDTELSKKEEVRAMFDNIAPAYDRLNHTLSLSVDRIWRRRVVRIVELSRALRPGGRIVILEFSTPTMPVFGRLYDWYSHRVLPRIGGWLSHDRQAYDYLPRSVDEFPQPEEFLTILAAAGFRDCRARSQSFGIAQIYTAEKC